MEYSNRSGGNFHFGRRRRNRYEAKRNEQSSKKRLKVVMKPSGILNYSATKHLKGSAKSFYTEPEDAAVPDAKFRYHLFKFIGDKESEIPLITGSSYLTVGRDPKSVDITIDKNSEGGGLVSKIHAVLQFKRSKDDPSLINAFILDLNSTNGTFLNGSKVELPKKRYIQLKSQDRLKFGDFDSPIEFVLVEDNTML